MKFKLCTYGKLNLTAWFSFHVISFRLHTCSSGVPRRTAILLFTNHNAQSTRDHHERTQNLCQQCLYNIYIITTKYILIFDYSHSHNPPHTHTHTHTRTYVYIYIYIYIMANALAETETLLHSVERAAAGIGHHVNAHKTEYMCFNQTGDISTQGGSSLKLVDKFTYLGSSVASIEKDIDTRLAKAWTASDSYRSYGSQTWPIKWNAVSSRQRSCRYYYGCTT